MIYGVDVSAFQAHCDWKRIKSAGKDFAFIKASEGLTYVSPCLQEQINGTAEGGLICAGIYHFARLTDDPAKQGQSIGSRARAIGVRPILDIETTPTGMSKSDTQRWMAAALKASDDAYGGPPTLLYSYYAYLQALQLPEYWAERPLWLAEYPKNPTPAIPPKLPAPWTDYTFWQYGGDANGAKCDGITGAADLNVWPGDIDSLARWCSIT